MSTHTRIAAAALILTGLLGGCVAYPTYPAYSYGYPAPYYGTVVVGGWHGGGWHGESGGWHH